MTWRDLWVFVVTMPADSALARSINPESVWGLQEQLLAAITDTARMLLWSKTEDAAKKRNNTRPKPIPRPGVESSAQESRIGDGEAHEISELRTLLGMPPTEG